MTRRAGAFLIPYDGGEHAGPMHYTARLAPPDWEEAWLVEFNDGEPELRLLCRVFANSRNELHDCAEALWLEGAHPCSVLELWWGENAGSRTPDRVMTTTIAAAVPQACAAAMTVMAMLDATRHSTT